MAAATIVKEILDAWDVLKKHEDAQAFGKWIWRFLSERPETKLYSNDTSIVSKALHRVQAGTTPRIALIGKTSSGKSTLANALFGKPIAATRYSRDTTGWVQRVQFPSGLVIYDTPGIFSKQIFENRTRAFIGLPQRGNRSERVETIPFKESVSSDVQEFSIKELREHAPFDMTLWIVDIAATADRDIERSFSGFYNELKYNSFLGLRFSTKQGPTSNLIVIGTKVDALDQLSPEEKREVIEDWQHICSGDIIPVSSTTGTGLRELVDALFRSLPDTVSYARLQEALVAEWKLKRLPFVVSETSGILAQTILLNGRQEDEVRANVLVLFALIFNHYSVDEQTWLRYSGDALRIGEAVQSAGEHIEYRHRLPASFWEKLRAIFGVRFSERVVEYRRVGVDGLTRFLPSIYSVLWDFEGREATPLTEVQVEQRVQEARTKLDLLINQDRSDELAVEIDRLLSTLLQ